MRLRIVPNYKLEQFDDWLNVVCEPAVRESNRRQLLSMFKHARSRRFLQRILRRMRYCRHPSNPYHVLFKSQ